jgi:integrase
MRDKSMADTQTSKRKPKGAHPHKRLTASQVKSLKRGRYADGNGLYLVVDETGARRWVLRTIVHGRRRDIGLGGTSIVSLAEARERALELRKAARDGLDPVVERDRHKVFSPTFAEAARLVHMEQIKSIAKNGKHVHQWIRTLETYAFPVVGSLPVHTIQQSDILRILAPIWTEKPETARRVRQRVKAVMDWARAAGHREGVNPVEGIEKGLAPQRKRVKHFAALPWQELPHVWQKISTDTGMGAVALRFAILTACRSGEVRGAKWSEIDLENRVWSVPEERMKAGKAHRVPLSDAAIAILNKAKLFRCASDLVFPSIKSGKALSDMTMSAVLRRQSLPVTVHGFRSTFRDWSEEATNFPHEVKEAALAHTVRNKAEAAYRRTDLFGKRRNLMAEWSAYVTQKS